MLKTPRRRGTEDDEEQHRQAKRAAPDAVWATELPTDLWKRCLDFAYGPATLCVDPLAPLKAAATREQLASAQAKEELAEAERRLRHGVAHLRPGPLERKKHYRKRVRRRVPELDLGPGRDALRRCGT